jgi:translation initiation factor 1
MEKRSFDKPVTIIDGAVEADFDESEVASALKSSFGCGGTVKDGAIELQGDHRERAKSELRERGFSVE